MRKLRSLTVLFLFVLAAMGFNPLSIQAEPEAPGEDCVWAYGTSGYSGVWSCSWGCDYFYEHDGEDWTLVDENCEMYD